ncbi:MAG: LysM peptidoglycan-binding domain-containing protein [Chloroflexi bacterium]|nr:LysM peptidoglycan-binding domain-containing protein [Chloroflexota bacterium]
MTSLPRTTVGNGLAIAAATGAFLLEPDWSRLIADARAPRTAIAASGADRVVVDLTTGVLWFISIWVACGLAASLVVRVPGAAGRLAFLIARRMLPIAVIRLVGGAAGLSVALAAPAAAAINAPTPPSPVPTTAAVSIGWPTDRPSSLTSNVPLAPSPSSSGKPAAHPAPHGPAPHPRKTDAVTVVPGDSLWAIAARRLDVENGSERSHPSDAEIAEAWPRWYARNRTVVGPNPSLIRPGQVLQPPG